MTGFSSPTFSSPGDFLYSTTSIAPSLFVAGCAAGSLIGYSAARNMIIIIEKMDMTKVVEKIYVRPLTPSTQNAELKRCMAVRMRNW